MEQEAPSNLLARLLVNEAAGLSFTALARKLQLSHNGRLVAVFGASEGQQSLKVIHDKPYLCTLCGACFTHTTQLRCHAQAKHGYLENLSSGGGSIGLERDLDLSNQVPGSGIAPRRKSSDAAYSHSYDTKLNSESSELLKNALTTGDSLSSLEVTKVRKEFAELSDGEVEADREGCTGDLPTCTHCDKSFVGQKNLEAHVIKHCGKEMHKCSGCKVAYVPSIKRTSANDDNPEEVGSQQYLMNSEGSNFTHNNDEGEGAKVDVELQDGQGIDCVLCGETFGILQHIITHIHAYTSFPCTFCDGEFPSMRDLGWHCKQQHDLLLVRCPFCSRGFREYSHLAFHMREHKGHLFCKICKVQCLSKSSYNSHMEIHEMNGGELEKIEEEVEDDSDEMSEGSVQKEKEKHTCHICSKPFNSFYSIFHHMRREHPMESLPSYNQDLVKRRFICKKCGFAFRRKDTLERHELIHKRGENPRRRPPSKPIIKPKPGNIMCGICNRAFLRPANLEAHMEEAHPEECGEEVRGKKKYCCDLCGKLLMSQKSLDRHVLVHQEPKYSCPICDKKLKHAETLKTHMRTHTGEKPYDCDICKQSFAQRSTYVQHMCIHSGERPHECDICQKTFIRRTELKAHQAKHTNARLFPCNFCAKTFKTEKHRKVHETQLHSDKAQAYQCEKCGKSFTWSSGLKAHACSHIDGDMPYKCQECNKGFSQPLFLKRHMHVHTKPFKCEQCYEGFKNKTDLKNHTAQVHGSGEMAGNQTQSIVPTQVQELISDHSWKPNKMMMDIGVDSNSPLPNPMSVSSSGPQVGPPAVPGPQSAPVQTVPGQQSAPGQQAPLSQQAVSGQQAVPAQLQQPNHQTQSSHSQIQASNPVQASIPQHTRNPSQGQIQSQMHGQVQGQMQGQMTPITNQMHSTSQNPGHARMAHTNRVPLGMQNQSMQLPNHGAPSHLNQVSISHPNQIPMPPSNHNPMSRPNQGGPMSLANQNQMQMRMSHTMSMPNPMQPSLSNQMSLPNQGLASARHRTSLPNQSQMSLPHPHQGQSSLPGQVQAPMGPGPGVGQPHHYLPDPMMQDRSMFGDQQYQVQDSNNQAIAAMFNHMSTL